MKIVFFCGSLEPGYDGVGDYTRLLALEIIKQGHDCHIIALNDQFISVSNFSKQNIGGDSIEVLRLPSSLKYDKKIKLAKNWIDELNPDLISLQFVIFSFHPKGIPLRLPKVLAQIGPGTKWHIMFHELWVGISESASKKHVLWGALQKYIIESLIYNLRPRLISTQSELYLKLLRKESYTVHHLPLFSNVLKYEKPLKNEKGAESKICMVVFGTIHPLSRLQILMEEVDRYVKKHNVVISLTLVGRCGKEVSLWKDTWESRGYPFTVLGEQPLDVISNVLTSSDIGISTSALYMMDKSGTVAAMLEHNLPVICVGQAWRPRDLKPPTLPPGIFDVSTPGCIELSKNHFVVQDSSRTLSGVARNFIESIENIENL